VDFTSAESRRSRASQRRLTRSRRLVYFLGTPLLRGLLWLLAATYRYQPTLGLQHIAPFLDSGAVCAPSYWHQHHILCSTLVRGWVRQGFRACFLVSGSVDGEVPERIARAWGAQVIRGSANQSGTLALRDMQKMMKGGYSIVTTADGPRGPRYEFKTGTVLMARIAGVPIVPLACAADRYWTLRRWDHFMIPKPFARVVCGVGKPLPIGADVSLAALEPRRVAVQEAVMALMRDCEASLRRATG
jgi:lysophospholipid acyltransferase (LPLAT)-like uncharacterized protein